MSIASIQTGVEGAISIRRFANDAIADVGARLDYTESERFRFLCECGDLRCEDFQMLTLTEYARCEPGHVLGHETYQPSLSAA